MPMLQLFLPKTGTGNACVYYTIRCKFRSFSGKALPCGCHKYHSEEKRIPGISSFAFYYCFSYFSPSFCSCFFSGFSLSFFACFFFSFFLFILSCFFSSFTPCFFPFGSWTKEKKKGRQKENAAGHLPYALPSFSSILFQGLRFSIPLSSLCYSAGAGSSSVYSSGLSNSASFFPWKWR